MTHFDVFNGDADGICALIQLRLAERKPSTLITGVKRDISLLSRVNAQPGDSITALDISLEKNAEALSKLLQTGVPVFYADHHAHGEIPDSPLLDAHIDTRSDTCTSLIINELLDNRFANWAVTAAFGDNMNESATRLAQHMGLDQSAISALKELGNLINYNGYGTSTDDLHYHPADLYAALVPYSDPLDFLASDNNVFPQLKQGFESDLTQAETSEPEYSSDALTVYSLPDEKWSRRVSGVFGNYLASAFPDRAHAILTTGAGGQKVVSLRAPVNNPHHADEIAKQFPSGGGRRRAAGINALPSEELPRLIQIMEETYA